MFCNKCGNKMDDGASFCAKCGNKISTEESAKQTHESAMDKSNNEKQAARYVPTETKKKSAAIRNITIAAVALIIVVGGLFAWRTTQSHKSDIVKNSKETSENNAASNSNITSDTKIADIDSLDSQNKFQPSPPKDSVQNNTYAETAQTSQYDVVNREEPFLKKATPGEMVFIPAGEFIMGSNNKTDTDANAFPEHKMKLPDFWIDKYEVTNEEFMTFSTESNYPGEGAAKGADWRIFATQDTLNVPVVYITWNDAYEYCKSKGKRLPTEQEWEYAARGPNGNVFPWGMEWENRRSNTNEYGREAVDIGLFDDVSYFGVHDMLGNVQEWTASWYKSYPGGVADSKHGETLRVVRGLSTAFRGRAGNLWLRFAQSPSSLFYVGFRCARDATSDDTSNTNSSPAPESVHTHEGTVAIKYLQQNIEQQIGQKVEVVGTVDTSTGDTPISWLFPAL